MENCISVLASSFNFSVKNQLITWDGYNVPAHNISLFSVGVSSTYPQALEGLIEKVIAGLLSAMCIIDQMESEDAGNLMDTLRAFYNLCIKGNLPCLNLLLSNGVVLEITFIDLWSFRNSLKTVKEICSRCAGIGALVVRGDNVMLEQVISNGDTEIIEQNLYRLISGEEE